MIIRRDARPRPPIRDLPAALGRPLHGPDPDRLRDRRLRAPQLSPLAGRRGRDPDLPRRLPLPRRGQRHPGQPGPDPAAAGARRRAARRRSRAVGSVAMGRLDEVDLSLALSRHEAERELSAAWERLTELRLTLGGLIGTQGIGPPVCVLFEGWDASGKGGSIKRLVAPLDPRHVRVVQFAAPTYDEKRHHFLWRFWPALPGWGGMAVFDRSWYGRVLVERVERLATKEQWLRAYQEIREFERVLVAEGTVLVKFWLHVSEDEQLQRFKSREKDPLRQWKLTEEDWRNRRKRKAYERAIEQMLEETDQPDAPWTLVEGDNKRWARVRVLNTVV